MFTRKVNVDQEEITYHNPNCRTIRLEAGDTEFVPRDSILEHLPEFVENFLQISTREWNYLSIDSY
ncbi:Glycosyl transferase, group 1 [Richelia intracellularis]|nr:Glycosyl transferase, group 1 [Richelia intracellularis]